MDKVIVIIAMVANYHTRSRDFAYSKLQNYHKVIGKKVECFLSGMLLALVICTINIQP